MIITFSGKAHHGKDTAAEIVGGLLTKYNLGKYTVIHYADYLKMVCSKYFGWDGKKDEAGRTLLQHVGTDIVRATYPTFWAATVARLLDVLGSEMGTILIPDTRFPDEITLLKEYGYDVLSVNVVRLNDDGSVYESSLTEEQKQHPSETALDGYNFDYTIRAKSGIDNLTHECEEFMGLYLISNFVKGM